MTLPFQDHPSREARRRLLTPAASPAAAAAVAADTSLDVPTDLPELRTRR